MAAFSDLPSSDYDCKNPLISYFSEGPDRNLSYISLDEKNIRYNQKPPSDRVDWVNVISEKKFQTTQYRYAFLDNSLSIARLHGITPQSTREDNLPNSVRNILIRPRGTGKTFFGQMWLEFMKGDPDNRLDRTQLKQQYVHMFPSPGEFICIELQDFGVFEAGQFHASFNKGLESAMFPKLNSTSTKPLAILDDFISYLKELGRQAAFFIDGGDRPVWEYFSRGRKWISKFYEAINSAADVIPYCYVTASSRCGIECALDNHFVDLSYDPQWATTFGYTWEFLVSLYEQQLQILCTEYELDLEGLKRRIDFWKGGYYFSPDSKPTDSVYCLREIHQFLRDGQIHLRDNNDTVFYDFPKYSREFLSLFSRDSRVIYSISDFKAYKYVPARKNMTPRDLHMALLANGTLSIYPSNNEFVELRVPNEVWLSQFRYFLYSLHGHPLERLHIHDCILNGNLERAIRMMYPMYGELVKWELMDDAQPPLAVSEYQVQQVLLAFLFIQHGENSSLWQFDSDLTIVDESKRREILIRLKSEPPKYFIINVGIHQKSQDRTLNDVIVTKLTQALEYKKKVCKRYPDADDFQMIIVITKPNGELFTITKLYTEQEAISLTQNQTKPILSLKKSNRTDETTKSVKRKRRN